jgi:hypothetical protein
MVWKALAIILVASQPLILLEINITVNIDNILESIYNLDLEEEKDFKLRLRSLYRLFVLIYYSKVYFLYQTT